MSVGVFIVAMTLGIVCTLLLLILLSGEIAKKTVDYYIKLKDKKERNE